MIEELVGRVFAARNIAHLQRLTTTSYAQREHLGHFYQDVVKALDELVECYQGQFAPLGDVEILTPDVSDVAAYLREEGDWIESNRDEIAGDSQSVASLVDALVCVYTRTVYKLERLQ